MRAADTSIALLTPHGLRHSFASVADDLGLSEPTIAALLGHVGGGVTRGYIHKLDAALIAAADRVSGRIADLLAGKADAGAEVIELRDRRTAGERVTARRIDAEVDHILEAVGERFVPPGLSGRRLRKDIDWAGTHYHVRAEGSDARWRERL